ncbi:hypothetical protein UPYG_G00163460 [Umbra pygmaea]|uniref:Uncharacterized protein n=1 Tax=Umbra pygmaea TaxID=75934 RepID=A0ABD0WMG8_UMBPY
MHCRRQSGKARSIPGPTSNLNQTVHPIPLQDVLQVSMHPDQQVQRKPTNTSSPLPDELNHVHGAALTGQQADPASSLR